MKKILLIRVPVIVMMGIMCIFLCSCPKPDPLPEITTGAVTKVTDNSACCCGMVNFASSSDVYEKGICWCTSNNPSKINNFALNTEEVESYKCGLTGLTPNTTYYVRAFATNLEGTAYGNEISFKTPPVVTDNDGNTYHTVIIGDQTWMAENLKVTRYRNGDPIPDLINLIGSEFISIGAWAELEDQFNKGYGKLYNFYTISDSRQLAPEGWHIATDAEWKALAGTVDSHYPSGDPEWAGEGYLGFDVGGMLKSTADQWKQPNADATDQFGFSALPGGYFEWDSRGFQAYDAGTRFWTATPWNGSKSWYWAIFYNESKILRKFDSKLDLASVRCVKD